MTEGEKLIWAAVYAQRLTRGLGNIPPHVVLSKERWAMYEENVVRQAVEAATGAVHRLRGVLPSIVEGYGSHSDEVKAIQEMLEVPLYPLQEGQAQTRPLRPLPSPESMHGYADQFGGSDYDDPSSKGEE